MTFYLLFAMELKSRRVQFVGCTVAPHEQWMKQTARELTAFDDGFLNGKKYVIMDRDASFCESFRTMLTDEGIEPIRLPRRVKKLSRTQSAAFHTIYGVPDWRRINRLRLRCFRFRKCKNLLHLTVG